MIQLKGHFRANLAVPEILGNGENVLETVVPRRIYTLVAFEGVVSFCWGIIMSKASLVD
jgi:hypothetical protein